MSQNQISVNQLISQRFDEHKKLLLSNISQHEMMQNNTKDSGLGTTQGTISSNSSSNHTSPESDVHSDNTKILLRQQSTSTPAHREKLPAFYHTPNERNTIDQLEYEGNLLDTITKPIQRKKQRKMHPCEYCEKQFDRPSLLKRHTLTHTGERPFACKYCNKGFSTRSGVNTHERTHTGQRPYVCRICGRRFAAGSNLIFHKYTHTNNRRHACQLCPKAFLTPGDLKKHEYVHTGEWPFKCSVCERGFATERNLHTHEITHSGKKPYKCTVCSKSYAQESSLKTHSRLHTVHMNEDVNRQNNADKLAGNSEKSTAFMISNLLDDNDKTIDNRVKPSQDKSWDFVPQPNMYQSNWMYAQCKNFYDNCLKQITMQFTKNPVQHFSPRDEYSSPFRPVNRSANMQPTPNMPMQQYANNDFQNTVIDYSSKSNRSL